MRKTFLMLSAAFLSVAAFSFSAQAQTEETTAINLSRGSLVGQYEDYTDLHDGDKMVEGPLTLTLVSTTDAVQYQEYDRFFVKAGTHQFSVTAGANSKITSVSLTFRTGLKGVFSITSPDGEFNDANNGEATLYSMTVNNPAETVGFTFSNDGARSLTVITVTYIANGGSGEENPVRTANIELSSGKWDNIYPSGTNPLNPGTTFADSPFSLTYDASTTSDNIQNRGTRGLFMRKGSDYTFTINGNKDISKVVITASSALKNVTSPNGEFVASNYNTVYTWSSAKTVNGNFTFTICLTEEEGDYLSNAFLENIEVTYVVDPNAAQPADISFTDSEITVTLLNGTAPLNFSNPNDLPATFTSSNEKVAVVNGDVLELKGAGQAIITATTAATPQFEAGSASFTVNVVDGALNIAQMRAFAPVEGDEINVDFETVVSYYKKPYLYLLDVKGSELLGNATLVMTESSTAYTKDEFIPGGWKATNITAPGQSETWSGATKPYTHKMLDFVQYETKSSLSESDINRIIKLTNVSIYSDLPGDATEFIAVLRDGTSCRFSNVISENNADLEKGVYTLTGAVSKADGVLFFRPISYMRTGDLAPVDGLEFSATFPSTGEYQGIISFIPETISEPAGIVAFIKTSNDSAPITFEIPEGYDSMYYTLAGFDSNPLRAGIEPTDDWISEEDATDPEGFALKKGNVIDVDANGNNYNYYLFFGNQGMVNVEDQYQLRAQVVKDLSVSVEGIESVEEAAPEYYTIQGVKVANPVKGLYIKVVNGKASKVIIR
ncbi:MAG: hypothetical protein K2N03_01665 [Muribaculaceae bacterium]|nr:hypothetical protein [Muribaculaceae bacterium]